MTTNFLLESSAPMLRFTIPANSQIKLNVPSGSRGFIATTGVGAGSRGMMYFYYAQSGSIYGSTVNAASDISVSNSGNTMTITSTSGYSTTVALFSMAYGNYPTLITP